MDFQRIIKKHKWLIIIFLVALLVRITFVFSTPMQIWDETVYANLGYDLSNNPVDYSVANNGWSDFIPQSEGFYGWPNMGFRAPLLPYLLMPFYLFHLNFLVPFFVAIVGALFLLTPLHIVYSAKILTGVLFTFFVLLTFLSFWKGYEENNKKHKVLFGAFLALALLSRYTALWIMPIFLLYFLVRDKSLNFLKDKYLWYSILAFFVILVPWFIYGIFEYNNPLGAFIHGAKASSYWGGIQSWYFFFAYWWQMFSIIGIVFVTALVYILYKKEFFKKEIYLLLIWFVFFLGMAIYMPHKEDRFILAIVPTIALISGYFIDKIKKYKKWILLVIVIISLSSILFQFYINYKDSYTDTNKCFLEGNKFLQNQNNALIVTDESAIVYYYTKQGTNFYPNPWSLESLNNLVLQFIKSLCKPTSFSTRKTANPYMFVLTI
jgi:4-amino-4-deoxy-L-arabinose transferase-like glycosyltransferase